MKRSHLVLFTIGLAMLFSLVYLSDQAQQQESITEHVGTAQLLVLIDSKKIERAMVSGNHIQAYGKDRRYVAYTAEPWLITRDLRDHKIPYGEIAQQESIGGILMGLFWTFVLPVLFILLLLRFLANRQMGGKNGGAGGGGFSPFNVGKSNPKEADKTTTITFNDVAGVDEAVEELKGVVNFLKNPEKYATAGARIPKGVLLMGDTGCGKTMLAKAVAGEAGVPFLSMSGSEFVEMFVGVGASRVRDLFETARKRKPCIIFIDEIDAMAKKRMGVTYGGGNDEREQTLNQLLIEMDGFSTSDGVVVIGATNLPDALDSALLRPGRFDRRVMVHRPDLHGREAILKVHLRTKKLSPEVDLIDIARVTPGMSGAELESVTNEAAIVMADENRDTITQADLMNAQVRVVMGPARKGIIMSPLEIERTSYHEAGHALIAHLLPDADPVRRVTIIPRGLSLGSTWSAPDVDAHSLTYKQLLAKICMSFGGRAAEHIVYGEEAITTGASNDLEHTTELAELMVKKFGMSNVGLRSFGKRDDSSRFGSERSHSEFTASRIDLAINTILSQQYANAMNLLKENQKLLEALKSILIDKETIDAADIASACGRPKAVPA